MNTEKKQGATEKPVEDQAQRDRQELTARTLEQLLARKRFYEEKLATIEQAIETIRANPDAVENFQILLRAQKA